MTSLAYCVLTGVCRADNPQPLMHKMVEYYGFSVPTGDQWTADKAALAVYSKEQLVRALIAEIDIDRGSADDNEMRDLAAFKLFVALDLPPIPVCQELDKTQTPRRKTSLIELLQGSQSSEVAQALLRQLDDRRVAIEPFGKSEIAKPHALRVCDLAINALAYNLDPKDGQIVTMFVHTKREEEIIQKTLAKHQLARPKGISGE